MSAHTARLIIRRAKPVRVTLGNAREQLGSLSDWLRARETGHREAPKSKKNSPSKSTRN